MLQALKLLNAHFEAVFIGWMWLNAAALGVIVGKPWLGLIGLVTVLPFLVLYIKRVRSNAAPESATRSA